MFGKHLYKKSFRSFLRFCLWGGVACVCVLVILAQRIDLVSSPTLKWTLRDYSILSPHFYSVDQNGRPYKIEAEQVAQETPKVYRCTYPIALLERPDGTMVRIVSQLGKYQQDTHKLHLVGKVILSNTENYQIATEKADIDLANKTAVGQETVQGRGPLGAFEGTGFSIEPNHLRIKGPVSATIKEEAINQQHQH